MAVAGRWLSQLRYVARVTRVQQLSRGISWVGECLLLLPGTVTLTLWWTLPPCVALVGACRGVYIESVGVAEDVH